MNPLFVYVAHDACAGLLPHTNFSNQAFMNFSAAAYELFDTRYFLDGSNLDCQLIHGAVAGGMFQSRSDWTFETKAQSFAVIFPRSVIVKFERPYLTRKDISPH